MDITCPTCGVTSPGSPELRALPSITCPNCGTPHRWGAGQLLAVSPPGTVTREPETQSTKLSLADESGRNEYVASYYDRRGGYSGD